MPRAKKQIEENPVEEVKAILTIPGLKAELHFNGRDFSITGTTDGEAYSIVKQALSELRKSKSNTQEA